MSACAGRRRGTTRAAVGRRAPTLGGGRSRRPSSADDTDEPVTELSRKWEKSVTIAPQAYASDGVAPRAFPAADHARSDRARAAPRLRAPLQGARRRVYGARRGV